MGLIIADEEFIRGTGRIQDMSEELSEIITAFNSTIDKLLNEGICNEMVNSILKEKSDVLKTYSAMLSSITDNVKEYNTRFLYELDDADSYLND